MMPQQLCYNPLTHTHTHTITQHLRSAVHMSRCAAIVCKESVTAAVTVEITCHSVVRHLCDCMPAIVSKK